MKSSTSVWRLPAILRRERLIELMTEEDSKELFDWDFVEGLEKRKESIERLQWKLFAIIAPVFLFLAFSLLNIDVSVSVLGVSAQASKSLREILLLIAATFGTIAGVVNRDLQFVREMIGAIVEQKAQGKIEVKEFLEQRYGLSQFSPLISFSPNLKAGKVQKFMATILVFSAIAWLIMLATIVLGVQILNLIEVYYHPNVSPTAAWFVIAYAITGDVMGIANWFLGRSLQPYIKF